MGIINRAFTESDLAIPVSGDFQANIRSQAASEKQLQDKARQGCSCFLMPIIPPWLCRYPKVPALWLHIQPSSDGASMPWSVRTHKSPSCTPWWTHSEMTRQRQHGSWRQRTSRSSSRRRTQQNCAGKRGSREAKWVAPSEGLQQRRGLARPEMAESDPSSAPMFAVTL